MVSLAPGVHPEEGSCTSGLEAGQHSAEQIREAYPPLPSSSGHILVDTDSELTVSALAAPSQLCGIDLTGPVTLSLTLNIAVIRFSHRPALNCLISYVLV
jgi:hypothetical protein